MANRQHDNRPVGTCIYCGALEGLLDEHVLPYGLGGTIVLKRASCTRCAEETSKLERRLLRGHWWPYRQFLGLKSRRSKERIPDLPVTLELPDGSRASASLPMVQQSVAIVFELDPPAILEGKHRTGPPLARNAFLKILGPTPSVVLIKGGQHCVTGDGKLTIPINFDTGDLCRFLAKVAHGFAISRRGIAACSTYFLPKIILGQLEGSMTYVGGAKSSIIGSLLPGNGIHALMDRVNGQFLTVYIQLFRDKGAPPPIYEIVVGHLEVAT